MIDFINNNANDIKVNSVYNYDDFTFQELLSKFAERINQCIKIANESVKYLDYLSNGLLEEQVKKELQNMIESGELANIIDIDVFKALNNKIEDFYDTLNNKDILIDENIKDINTNLIEIINSLKQDLIKLEKNYNDLIKLGGKIKIIDTEELRLNDNKALTSDENSLILSTPNGKNINLIDYNEEAALIPDNTNNDYLGTKEKTWREINSNKLKIYGKSGSWELLNNDDNNVLLNLFDADNNLLLEALRFESNGNLTLNQGSLNIKNGVEKNDNGYCILTNGVKLQWGTVEVFLNNEDTKSIVVNFPTKFTNKTLLVIANIQDTNFTAFSGATCACSDYTLDNFKFTASYVKLVAHNGRIRGRYIAIGI